MKELFECFGRDGQLEFYRLNSTHVTLNTPDFRVTRQALDWAKRAGLRFRGGEHEDDSVDNERRDGSSHQHSDLVPVISVAAGASRRAG